MSMARLRSHKQPPQTEGSWVFEGPEHEQDDGDQDVVDEEEHHNSVHASTSLPAAASHLPIFTSNTSRSPQLNSPVFPPSLDGRMTSSSYQSGSTPRRNRPIDRSAPSIRSSEPQFVMPSMEERQSQTTSPRRGLNAEQPMTSNKRLGESSHFDNSTLRERRAPKRAKTGSSETPLVASYLETIWTEVLHPSLQTTFAALRIAFSFFKPLLVFLLGLGIFASLSQFLFAHFITRALAPICDIPGMSYLNIPFCNILSDRTPGRNGPVEFDELMTVQSAFEDVLANAAGGVTLPLDMKRSEASVRDLKHVVQYSSLPSKNELVFEFTGFIETARQAAADLTRFNSRIGRAVDHVLSTNRWTLQVIDGVAAREEARGAVGKLLQNTLLAPFRTARVTEDLLLEQYLRHTRAIEDQIAGLILEAQALLGILQNLDDRIDVIHGITTREGVTVKGDREQTMVQLWTWLGGNRAEVKKHNDQLMLLGQLHVYRKTAWEHVSGTMLKLQGIAAGLEDLRERLGAAEVVGVREEVPLRLHIERIQMGVERLEERRGESRRVEGQAQRAILDRDEAGDGVQQARLLERT